MSFWGNDRWLRVNETEPQAIVDSFDPQFLKDGCYKLAVGIEAIVSSTRGSSEEAYRALDEKSVLSLQPGQFAYLITGEEIHMPRAAIGFINIDSKTKLRGLINIS